MHPPIRLRILASGSSGNAAILSLRPRNAAPIHAIIDLGLSPRKLCGALAAEGISPAEVSAILLTHADADHLHSGWSQRWPFEKARVIARGPHHRAIRGGGIRESFLFEPNGGWRAPGAELKPIELPHDQAGSTGFRISLDGASLGWATDLGRVPPEALEFFAGVDALCIESNYDTHLQRQSSRPDFLKQRIMGGRGHLSNHETLEAVLHLHRRHPLRQVVLLHLSAQCNNPALVRSLWSERAPELAAELQVATQAAPLPWLAVGETRPCQWSDSLFAEMS
ncbi:MAG: MBL fold metallo-hydrolase [Planctomycetes bacterium]|nr:MBL fold metallo-hydrolase [Planctomycetota bacterium]